MAQRSKGHVGLQYAAQLAISAAAVAGLAGCGTLGEVFDKGKIDYRSAAKAQTKSLEVPPDLTQLRKDNRYAIPEAVGSATASSYNLGNAAQPAAAAKPDASAGVLPKLADNVKVARNGNQRYLVTKLTPDDLWPQIKDFWQELGFLVISENPQTGVMETDWAENRAKLPQDAVRNTLGKVFDFLYATSERDKFRTRIERNPDGTTEIYISHRGMQEVLTGQEKETTVWTARPADPELEAEFLMRLMTRLGSEAEQAKAAVAKAGAAPAAPARAKVSKEGETMFVAIDEEFERAWRRVGLALDRVGFTVEDRDRTVGLYFVRYIDDAVLEAEAKRSFWSRLFIYDGDKTKAQKIRVSVKGTGESSRVTVQTEDGKPDNSATAEKILKLVAEQLK